MPLAGLRVRQFDDAQALHRLDQDVADGERHDFARPQKRVETGGQEEGALPVAQHNKICYKPETHERRHRRGPVGRFHAGPRVKEIPRVAQCPPPPDFGKGSEAA